MQTQGTRSKTLPTALLLAAATLFGACGGGTQPMPRDVLDKHRKSGDFAAARQEVERLRVRWAGEVPENQAKLEAELQRIADTEAAVAARTELILQDPALGYAAAVDQLQAEEKRGSEAARIVRGSLNEILARRPRPAPSEELVVPETARPVAQAQQQATPEPVARAQSASAPVALAPVQPAAGAQDAKLGDAPAADALTALFADATAMAASGRFAQAVELLQVAKEGSAEETTVRLQQRIREMRASSNAALAALLEEARALAKSGELGGAVARLGSEIGRFAGGAELVSAERELAGLRTQLAESARPVRATVGASGAPETVRRATLEQLRTLMDRIRAAEQAGDFAAAAALLREGAKEVEARDADYAKRLGQRAEEAEGMASLHKAVGTWLAGGGTVELDLEDGTRGKLQGVDGSSLVLGVADGSTRAVSWVDLPGAAIGRVVEAAKLPAEAWLGAAALAYRNGEGAAAEAMLAKLLAADAKRAADVNAVLARGRGEEARGGGYTLVKGQFVSEAKIAADQKATKLVARLDSLLKGKDAAARDKFVQDLLAEGPDALAPVVTAFHRSLAKQVETLSRSPLRKEVDKLAARRIELDEARTFAKDLIYDEEKYFYPYRPPAVSADKFAEYNRVQAEVDRRVAAVKLVWDDERTKVRVPATLRDELDRLDWTARTLRSLGELDLAVLGDVVWARALPPGDTVDIRNFCTTPEELDQFRLWERIEEFNRKTATKVSAGEREQLEITNAYRRMFGHRPVALNLKVSDAARGHAEEMANMGYFAHFSPTPGRRTPFDRMKLAGYDHGASENIALNDGAMSSHVAWCHSSGHHRNLLSPGHKEFGIGNNGRYWVQNFGGGAEFENDPVFVAVK
ncbi:MAG: hypothetical protein RL148_2876 [Planctomycetota bacterium]|jgi:hypothetical protein